MNIQELQLERDALQKRLKVKIQKELEAFTEFTGVGVDFINIHMESIWAIHKPLPDYFVSEVNVNLDL